MSYFSTIIFAVVAFVVILYLLVFSKFTKNKFASKNKNLKKQQSHQNLKKIDPAFYSSKKEMNYKHHFFSGKKLVITGDLKYFKTRNDLAQLLWDNGATIEKNFNSAIDVLIVGKSNIDSLKLKSAYYLNIKVIAEEELFSYFPDFKPFLKESISELQLN